LSGFDRAMSGSHPPTSGRTHHMLARSTGPMEVVQFQALLTMSWVFWARRVNAHRCLAYGFGRRDRNPTAPRGTADDPDGPRSARSPAVTPSQETPAAVRVEYCVRLSAEDNDDVPVGTSTGSSRRTRASIWTDDQVGPSSRMGYSTGPAEAGATFGPQKGARATEVALLERDPSPHRRRRCPWWSSPGRRRGAARPGAVVERGRCRAGRPAVGRLGRPRLRCRRPAGGRPQRRAQNDFNDNIQSRSWRA
jgi:hypothetical protein